MITTHNGTDMHEVGDLTSKEPAGITVRFDALGGSDPITARVKEFATETDSQTQTFPVTLELEVQRSVAGFDSVQP